MFIFIYSYVGFRILFTLKKTTIYFNSAVKTAVQPYLEPLDDKRQLFYIDIAKDIYFNTAY
jgi:hypothetical protein